VNTSSTDEYDACAHIANEHHNNISYTNGNFITETQQRVLLIHYTQYSLHYRFNRTAERQTIHWNKLAHIHVCLQPHIQTKQQTMLCENKPLTQQLTILTTHLRQCANEEHL